MSELQEIEATIHSLEEKIDAWFHRHFGAFTPDTQMHQAAIAAHHDLKTVVGIAPAAPAPAAPTDSPAA